MLKFKVWIDGKETKVWKRLTCPKRGENTILPILISIRYMAKTISTSCCTIIISNRFEILGKMDLSLNWMDLLESTLFDSTDTNQLSSLLEYKLK